MTAKLIFRSSLSPDLPDATKLKGSPLTNAEIDANFLSLSTEIDTKAPINSPTFIGNVTIDDTGAITIPRGTEEQRPASPKDGMLRYNSDLNSFEGYKNGSWGSIGSGATGGSSDQVFYCNDKTINHSYSIPEGKNAMTTGPIELKDGVTVSVPDGSRLVIL